MAGIRDFDDHSSRVGDYISSVHKAENDWSQTEGTITLRSHGAVLSFYIYAYPSGHGWTGLSYVMNGREHRRKWPAAFARRTLYRLARQFLDDLGVERQP